MGFYVTYFKALRMSMIFLEKKLCNEDSLKLLFLRKNVNIKQFLQKNKINKELY